MGRRHRGRELAFQVLFQLDQSDNGLAQVLKQFGDLKQANAEARQFAEELSKGASLKTEEIDRLISATAKNWSLKRLASVDRALLRLGAYELLYRDDIPPEVSLDECVELAKVYGSEESPGFINGVLDTLRKGHRREGRAARPKSAKK